MKNWPRLECKFDLDQSKRKSSQVKTSARKAWQVENLGLLASNLRLLAFGLDFQAWPKGDECENLRLLTFSVWPGLDNQTK